MQVRKLNSFLSDMLGFRGTIRNNEDRYLACEALGFTKEVLGLTDEVLDLTRLAGLQESHILVSGGISVTCILYFLRGRGLLELRLPIAKEILHVTCMVRNEISEATLAALRNCAEWVRKRLLGETNKG